MKTAIFLAALAFANIGLASAQNSTQNSTQNSAQKSTPAPIQSSPIKVQHGDGTPLPPPGAPDNHCLPPRYCQ